jgi:hypothetical protein
MRQRSREAQILAGAVVAGLLTAAAPVVYVALSEGTSAVRSGLHVRALQMGAVALVATVTGVVAVAVYAHWLAITVPPERPARAPRVPSRAEVAVEGVVVCLLLVGAWPVSAYAYRRAVDALEVLDVAWAVGWALAGLAYLLLAAGSLVRFVPWARLHTH